MLDVVDNWIYLCCLLNGSCIFPPTQTHTFLCCVLSYCWDAISPFELQGRRRRRRRRSDDVEAAGNGIYKTNSNITRNNINRNNKWWRIFTTLLALLPLSLFYCAVLVAHGDRDGMEPSSGKRAWENVLFFLTRRRRRRWRLDWFLFGGPWVKILLKPLFGWLAI